MSTAVVETSSHPSSQPARQKPGQGSQTSPGDGFSGLVDGNLNAAGNDSETPQPDRPRTSRRSAAAETGTNARTGLRRKGQDQTQGPRVAPTSGATSTSAGRAGEDDVARTTDAARAALEIPLAVVAPVAASAPADADADQVEAPPADDTSGDAQAPTPAALAAPAVPTTGIVAAAVVVQIGLAADTPSAQVIAPSDAIAVSTLPTASVPAPAGTAASALARVALDTGDTQTTTPAATGTDTAAPAPTLPTVASETTVAAPPAQATAATAAAATETTAATAVVVEVATAAAQLDANAQTEFAAAAKAEPARAPDKPQAEPIVASADPKPAPTTRSDDTRSAQQQPAPPQARPQQPDPQQTGPRQSAQPPQQPPQPTADARNDPRVEAAGRHDDQPNPAEADAPATQRIAHEQAPSIALHAQNATAGPLQQAGGFGLSHTALPVQAGPVPTAQLTAIPVAANMPVPVGGLAVEIAVNAQIGRSRFDIRLDPPELGRIDVRLDVDQKGQVTSHLIVEKSATLDLLRRDAPQLERALQDAGLKTSDNGLQFSLRDQQQQQAGRNGEQDSRNAQRLVVTDEETIAAETAGRSYGRMMGQRGGIDIRV